MLATVGNFSVQGDVVSDFQADVALRSRDRMAQAHQQVFILERIWVVRFHHPQLDVAAVLHGHIFHPEIIGDFGDRDFQISIGA